ncbi:MAG: diaminopimelate decarboxylase [Phycisphaerales bacterium]|nr:diaminopimelate decarboxylase [Phycisphaerales bacterium]
MASFGYRNGELYCEDMSAASLAQRFGTPLYVYARGALEQSFDRMAAAFAALSPKICFSIKSCSNLHVLRLLRQRGAAFDAVSIGEVRRAIEAGAPAADIVFAGVGKTRAEIDTALQLGVGCFNVESAEELAALRAAAAQAGLTVRAALRVNPDVDAHTHPYTTTGKDENKFGINLAAARDLFAAHRQDTHVRLTGIHLHIGSPVNTVEPYVETVGRALQLIDELAAQGVAIDLLNLGGGWGACYQDDDAPPIEAYADAIVPLLAGRNLDVHFEPGRSIAADAGVLLARVVYRKASRSRRFVIVDTAMTDLIRPALYDAYHFLWPVSPGAAFTPASRRADLDMPGLEAVDVVGPVCESSDFLAKQRCLPPLAPDDLLAVFSAGAYGFVMASQYNSRPRAAEVLVHRDEARLIRRRETYDDLVAAEREV